VNLNGLTVVVARDEAPDDDISRAISAAGGTVVPLPLMRIVPPEDGDALAAICRNLDRYDTIAFTSRHAVKALVSQRFAPPRGTIAAVGAATAKELKAAGWRVDIVGQGGGRELGARLATPSIAGTWVLLPRAADAHDALRDRLQAAGASVDVVEAYRSVPIADPRAIRQAWAKPRPLALVLTSPARVATLMALAPVPADVHVVVVGATTAAACVAAGIPVAAVAAAPGPDPLCLALESIHKRR